MSADTPMGRGESLAALLKRVQEAQGAADAPPNFAVEDVTALRVSIAKLRHATRDAGACKVLYQAEDTLVALEAKADRQRERYVRAAGNHLRQRLRAVRAEKALRLVMEAIPGWNPNGSDRQETNVDAQHWQTVVVPAVQEALHTREGGEG